MVLNLPQHVMRRVRGEVSQCAIPDDHVILLAGKRLFNGIHQVIGNVGRAIRCARLFDGAWLDIDRIDMSTTRAEKSPREKSVPTSNVQQPVVLEKNLGGK